MLIAERVELAIKHGRLWIENHNLKRKVWEYELDIECRENYKTSRKEREIAEREQRTTRLNEQIWNDAQKREERNKRYINTRRTMQNNYQNK